ncbi:D-lyxose/D-mannose family sugar isomerase [Candidatus Bipolaricaulota bacterium]|nr:D-lyxose/D-mannose family sugar isomerase [Candidatus Bipolaricaulota bacterium]
MKRSDINRILQDSQRILATRGFALPAFASWTPSDWATKSTDVRGIVERGLGWDMTDFGLDHFEMQGLVLFTLRNGSRGGEQLTAAAYAEKVMIAQPEQLTPMHSHWEKTEDIINRGGGRLAIRVFNATEDGQLADNAVTYVSDGQRHTVPAGHIVMLEPGASITIPAGLYHSFWAVDAPVVIGEVSTVNDDEHDNRFLEEVARFPSIEEDEPPIRLLVSDYSRFL